ncbi:MAG: UDP-N-acetylmuramate:L-alanyl-gamma-D-glutamyl-meso-diaminopimelate ligase [Burkholderiales bacterium]|nr:UDP-N-acetylmuramate:L-alanyl-gamma-D-glutamyl-meso-diaminopimelate ligase [Burkholderiales bacterium]
MHIHILGICGTFMGGLAALAREAGHKVTGCDANVYPPMSDQLQALGIDLIEGYSPDQLRLQPDCFVIGNVVTRGNPLIEAILDANLDYVSGPQWLADHVLRHRHVLAVAGTHGKTTTTSMLAWILTYAERNPGFLIGGVAQDFGVSARLGSVVDGHPFVIEADEYDTAFFDKRSKFVHYKPRTLVLNNLEYDHADIFPDVAAIRRQFHHVVRIVPAGGRVIYNGADAEIAEALAMGCWSGREPFGVEQGWHLTADGRVDFGGERFGLLQLDMPGEHNRLNALAAIAAARHLGVSPTDSIAALARFKGVKRRMELRGEAGGVKVYDDFAHHPTAIAATIMALRRAAGPDERILAVFEPRSNTMKLGAMRARLPASFDGAARVYSYSGGVNWDVAEALAPIAERAADFRDLDALVCALAVEARPGDHILIMSNGGFGGIHAKLLQQLTDPRKVVV